MPFGSTLFDNLGDNCIQNVHFREDISSYIRTNLFVFGHA